VVDLSWGPTAADAERTYQMLPQSGSKWIRVGVGWRSLETSRGVYSASKLALYDTIAARARGAGQRVLFNIVDTPGWANGGQGANVPPTDPASIAPFLRFMAARYSALGVEAFEIWNEQDSSRFWNPPDPARYAALLKVAHTAIKAAAPSMLVVTGGTSGNDYAFWSRAYEAGIAGHFDVMGLHPYTGRTTPDYVYYDSAGRIAEWAFVGYREIRRLMLAHGDDKPIWFTELGWSSATDGGWASVGAITQAAYLTRAYEIMRNDPYVGVGFWYSLRDGDWAIDATLGPLTRDFAPKPSYAAFQSAALPAANRR
jgi:polysaccharide biosynthesis protein PslG